MRIAFLFAGSGGLTIGEAKFLVNNRQQISPKKTKNKVYTNTK